MILYIAKLSEDSKRLIIALLFVLIILFVIVGCIGTIIKKVMKRQAQGADDMMYDVVRAGIFNRKKDLIDIVLIVFISDAREGVNVE